MTVSNAYNRPDQLSAATRERVLAAATRVGYAGPDPTAASLRLRRTGTIGVVLTERLPYAFTDPGMVQILHGMTTELSDAGMSLLLIPDSGGGDGTAQLLRHAMVDALVLCSLDAADPAVGAAVERKVPLVTVGHPRLPRVPTVGIDNAPTAALMAPHLLELGHRRFAVLTVGGARLARPGFKARPEGFIGALSGIDPDSVMRCEAETNTRAAGAAAVGELLALPEKQRPTALFAVTDVLALGALDAAAAAGIEVPGELSIAGLDDIPEASTSNPPLTTLNQHLFEQGQLAVRVVLKQISGESVRVPRTPVELVVRGSTGPPRH